MALFRSSPWYVQFHLYDLRQRLESCISFCLATLNHPAGYGLSDGDYAVTVDEVDNRLPRVFEGRWVEVFLFSAGGSGNGGHPPQCLVRWQHGQRPLQHGAERTNTMQWGMRKHR